jgi:formylglycine-generating enzyme
MNLSKLFLSLLFSASMALCQINITGKVIDTLGNPVRGAQVSLTVAGIKDTTDSIGQFALATGSTGNPLNKNIKPLYGSPFIKNHVLFFSVLRPGTQILVDVFNVSGRLVAHVLNRSFENGNFRLDVKELLKNSSRNAISFVRLKIGNEAFALKWVMIGSTNFNTGHHSGTTQNALEKTKATNDILTETILDTLIISHDGYFSKRIDLDTLTGTLGNIHLYSGTDFTAEQENTFLTAYSDIAKKADSIFLLGNADSVFKDLIVSSRKIAVVETAGVENGSFYVKFKNGGILCWLNEPVSQLDTTILTSGLPKKAGDVNGTKIDKKACVICGPTFEQYCNPWATFLSNYLTQTIDIIENDQFDLKFIANKITDYDYVILITHGKITHGNIVQDRTWIVFGKQPSSLGWFFKYFADIWTCSRIMHVTVHDENMGIHKVLAVSDLYLKDEHDVNRKFRDNSFFYSASCDFLNKPEQMGATLSNNFGCKAVAGWSKENCTGRIIEGSGGALFRSLFEYCSPLKVAIDNLSPELKMNCQNLNTNSCDLVSTCTSDNLSYLQYYPASAADFQIRTDCVSPPQTPTLTSPADGAIGQSATPTLAWSTVTNAATYHVQVSTSNTFSPIQIEDSTLTSGSKSLSGLANNTNYYWRVRAKNAGGVSGWTSPWSFTTIIATLPGMVAIPAGTFMMGQAGIQYAVPVHQVTLSPFWMDITEVTQKDYLALMHFNPSYYQGDVNRPVEQVTWYDAVLYCNARSKRDGYDTVYYYSSITGTPGNGCTSLGNLQIDYSKSGYRLPTEAEFEYALRAGTTTLCFWGNDSTAGGNYAWCGTNSGTSTHPVATKLPNPWGLYDIAGNVEEWNNDWETDANYPNGNPQTDPTGPPTGTFGFISKSLRGGLYWDLGYYMRSAQRGCHYPYNSDQGDGFRCVLPRK